MIVWQRWGILVIVAIGLLTGLGFLLELVLAPGSTKDNALNGVFIGIGWMIGGVLVHLLAKYVLERHLDKPYLVETWANLPHPETTPEGDVITRKLVSIKVQPRSSLFFIPVRWWAFIVPAFGFVVFVANLVTVLGR